MKQAAKPPYATEFKESAVQLAVEGDKSIAAMAHAGYAKTGRTTGKWSVVPVLAG